MESMNGKEAAHMRRILLVLSVAVVMVAMVAALALPAMADTYYECDYYDDGSYDCIWWDE